MQRSSGSFLLLQVSEGKFWLMMMLLSVLKLVSFYKKGNRSIRKRGATITVKCTRQSLKMLDGHDEIIESFMDALKEYVRLSPLTEEIVEMLRLMPWSREFASEFSLVV